MENLDLEVHHGTYLVFGLQLLRCNSNKSDFLVESKAALAGWRKARPSNMRLPVPEDFVFDFCHLAISEGKLDLAFMMALQINTYLRPSEVLSLTVDHIGKPHGRRYSSWTVIVAPSDLDVRTKTGSKDDAVIVGDLACQSWVGDALALYMKKVNHKLFSWTLPQYEAWMTQACNKLSYKSQCVSPHILRHAGASNDFFFGRRSLLEIQRRGRWKAKASVQRYEKSGLLQKRWEQASAGRISLIHQRSQELPYAMLKALRQHGRARAWNGLWKISFFSSLELCCNRGFFADIGFQSVPAFFHQSWHFNGERSQFG